MPPTIIPDNNKPPTQATGRRLFDFLDRQSNAQQIHLFRL